MILTEVDPKSEAEIIITLDIVQVDHFKVKEVNQSKVNRSPFVTTSKDNGEILVEEVLAPLEEVEGLFPPPHPRSGAQLLLFKEEWKLHPHYKKL